MYRVRDLMSGRALSITPDASIEAAMDLLRLQQTDLLPVVEEDVVVGLLDSLWLYRFHGELPVREVMQPPVTIPADAPVGEAAARMQQHHLRQLPVTEDGRLVGILSHRDLLETWGASRDTRTSLPWQDLMRRWAAAHLTAGREIAVLFIDLNDFGRVNKTHGHVAGDRALKTLADTLRVCVDPRRDLLCRYAGDEFAIATTRTQEDAWRLVLRIRDEVARLPRSNEDPPIGVSIGMAGGKRRAPRPGDHAPATLDDLINWASRASTEAKKIPGHCVIFEGTGPGGPEFTTEPTPGAGAPAAWREDGAGGVEGRRLAVDTYSITQAEAGVQVDVALRQGEEFYRASATHPDDRLLAIAQATAACLQALLVDEARLRVDDVRVLTGGPEPGIVIALLTLAFPHRQEPLLGAVQLGDDRFRSVINAVLDAANRRLALFARNKDGPEGAPAARSGPPAAALYAPDGALGAPAARSGPPDGGALGKAGACQERERSEHRAGAKRSPSGSEATMKILVTGGRGMLGTDLCAALDREHEVTAVGSAEMEVTSADAVRACVARERPDWILHCAAYTDVDGCERDPDRAFRVNALGTWHVALASAEQDSALLVISTDFVFDGEKRAPYTEFDAPRPINQYGASKRAGEELALRACPRCTIVRTQWLYGLQGNCFPETILRAAAGYPPERSEGRVRRSLRVVDDQIGAPTFTRDLAAKIAELIGTTKRQDLLPIVHINNAGECSWHEFAVAVLRGSGIDTPVTPIAARDWPSPTRRPAYSVLRRYALELTGKDDMRPWQEALAEYLSERGARK